MKTLNFISVIGNSKAIIDIRQLWIRSCENAVLNSGLLVGRGKKSQISRDFQGQIRGKKGDFAGISREFRGNFQGHSVSLKNVGKERPISWELPEQIPLESDWFCADLRKVFNETRRSYSIYSGFIPQYEIALYK